MMILISGQPGNGKSLRAMALMLEEQQRNLAANKLPQTDKKWEPLRLFFSNIAGSTRDENPEAFEWVLPMPVHNDWRQLPDNSYVVYDEAHADGNTEGLERYGLLFPTTGKPGEASDPRIKAMSTHRHRGFDLVFLTQWPNKVHHTLRTLVGKHIHMNRALGLQRAGVLSWTRVQADPYDEDQRAKAEEEIWAFPVDLYGRYKSATSHSSSYKFKIPGKVWGALSMLCMAIFVAWMLWLFVFKPDPKPEPVEGATAQGQGSLLPAAQGPSVQMTLTPEEVEELPASPLGTGVFDDLAAAPAPRIAGYVDSPKGCRVWDTEGNQLDMTTAKCRALVDLGMPVHFASGRGGEGPGMAERGAGVPPAAMAGTAASPFSSLIGSGGVGGAEPSPGPPATSPPENLL